jgi:cytochrome c oxidase subunit IV
MMSVFISEKQNLNVLLAFFADLGITFGLFLLTRLLSRWGVQGAGQLAFLSLILFLMAGLTISLLFKMTETRLPRIEA